MTHSKYNLTLVCQSSQIHIIIYNLKKIPFLFCENQIDYGAYAASCLFYCTARQHPVQISQHVHPAHLRKSADFEIGKYPL